MKKINWKNGLMVALAALVLAPSMGRAQQFRISNYDGENVTIEYPPSFDGAYLFIERSTNLLSGEWEVIDYSQISLVEGDEVLYSPSVESTSGGSTNITEIPTIMTPEYLQALSNGEITNSEWTAVSTPFIPSHEGDSASYRIMALSFVDSDGDGIDNVTEHGAGTDPNVSDAPAIDLPVDDGDPRVVPGSVDSAPGDWNTPVGSVYYVAINSYEGINARIFALDGTNGTFTAQTPVATLGAWIAAQCGAWQAVAGDDLFPTVNGGRFYRTPEIDFSWTGKENIFSLALHAYDGSEAFVNHLIQSTPSDPVGLARLSDQTPVFVNASNPWTNEKIQACLRVLITIECRLQRVVGGAFDPTDTTAMAQSQQQWKSGSITRPFKPTDRFLPVLKIAKYDWQYNWYEWQLQLSSTWYSRAQKFTFLNNLQAHGFGETIHRGYLNMLPATAWTYDGSGYTAFSWQTNMPSGMLSDLFTEVFTCADNDTCWFMADSINYADTPNEEGIYTYAYGKNVFLTHKTGYESQAQTILSTLIPPRPPETTTLIMDMDRDGVIGTNDFNRVDKSHPYRFWVNEDGNSAPYPEADLEDFFPAMFMGTGSNQTFKLSANVALDYIPTTMTVSNSMEYLHDIDLAQTLAIQIQTLAVGTQTTQAFNENDLILLAASGVNTNAELYVHILENGSEIGISTNHFSFSSITNMYRTKNLRAGGTSTLDEPANWSDELTNDKDIVFVHGFNVDEDAAKLWHKNIFKRLWFAGSNAKYHGIIWDGIGNGSILTHFHNSVVNAFATAPWVSDYIKTLSASETIVLGHSLGNVVVSSAICEHNAPVTQYYAIDAAVALEAYGDVTPCIAFVPDVVFTWEKTGFLNYKRQGWRDYPFETWAAEWYRLFPENDPRSKLTFRHKFADIQLKTDAFNFYSSTEDVLRVRDDVNQILQSITDVDIEMFMHILPVGFDISSQCSWQLQEMYKGMNNWAVKYGGGGSSQYTGWSFTEYDGVHQIDKRVKRPFYHPPTYIYTKYFESGYAASTALGTNTVNATIRAEYLETLKIDPLFNRNPSLLFNADAATFAGGIVGDYESILDYDNSEQHGAPDIDVSNVKVSDWLLAKGFPSRTGPMGSTKNKEWPPQGVNFDMHNLYMTDLNAWPHEDDDENKEWQHSSWKNAPYVHVYKLFEKITTKEN